MADSTYYLEDTLLEDEFVHSVANVYGGPTDISTVCKENGVVYSTQVGAVLFSGASGTEPKFQTFSSDVADVATRTFVCHGYESINDVSSTTI